MDEEDFTIHRKKEVFHPKIFLPHDCDEPIPPFFNSVSLLLDGRMSSTMDWKKELQLAASYAAKGLKLFWNLNLGLFSKLDYSIADETQFQALVLSLQHFKEAVWKDFNESSIGLSLYQGSGDFSKGYPWDDHQMDAYAAWLQKHQIEDQLTSKRLFCSETTGDYLRLLAATLPDDLPLFAFLDTASLSNPLEIARILSKQRFERIRLGIKSSQNPCFTWNESDDLVSAGIAGREPSHLKSNKATISLCLPEISFIHPSYYQGLEDAFIWLEARGIDYKVIPEPFLITEWDGLDYIIYSPSGLSAQGKRKLQGFCAAGGTAVSTEELLGLSHELQWSNFASSPLFPIEVK